MAKQCHSHSATALPWMPPLCLGCLRARLRRGQGREHWSHELPMCPASRSPTHHCDLAPAATQVGEGELFEGVCDECAGNGYCENCDDLFPEEDLYRGLCTHCLGAEDDYAIHHGVCPGCMKRMPPCQMDEDGEYECCT